MGEAVAFPRMRQELLPFPAFLPVAYRCPRSARSRIYRPDFVRFSLQDDWESGTDEMFGFGGSICRVGTSDLSSRQQAWDGTI